MSNARPFWIAWCCGWALCWFVFGFFTFGLAWFGTGLSLLAILIPVGAPARLPQPPTTYVQVALPPFPPPHPQQYPQLSPPQHRQLPPVRDHGPGNSTRPWYPPLDR
jgi:hypothetical protein